MDKFKWHDVKPIYKQPRRPLKHKIPFEQKVVTIDNEVYEYYFINGQVKYLYLFNLNIEKQ